MVSAYDLENSTWIISHYQLHSAAIMLDMYEDRKDEDGFLYIQYSGEPHKPSQEDTDDEMNTSSLNHDDLIPTISASTSESEEDNAAVLEFFKKLCSCLSSSMTHLEEMIKAKPYLLEAKCPHKIPGLIQKGFTAMEAVCQQGIGAATRDLLYELVLLGGKATDKCYEELDRKYNVPFDHLTVLLLSGYYPTKGDYLFLDQLANVFIEELENDDGEVDPIEMLSILYKVAKLGDNLSCGPVDSTIINNINQLPLLEVGVTHSKGGPMEELLKQYPVEKVEQKKKEREEEEKSPNPDHEEMPIKSGLKWTPPDHSTSRVSSTEQKRGNHEEVSNNKSTAARTCSVCKLAKSTKDFSKNQRGKGAAAKCKDCIATMQQRIQEAQEIKKQKAREKSELLATENKMMEALDERQCAKCRITKKKEAFDLVQLRKGKSAECEDCVAEWAAKQAERQRIAMEEEKKRRKIRIQPIIEENEKFEDIDYKQKKERYEQYAKKLEEEGRSIIEEMESTSSLVYVVTSANRGMDPFSPHLHGIYTTCNGAQESARRAFAEVSSTYRGGKFLPNDERIAKCDVSEFLIPGIKCNSRIMFEMFGEGDCVDYRSVTVTAVPIDQAESRAYRPDIPCLASYEPFIPLEVDKVQSANPRLIKGTKVYAIFSRQAEYIDGGGVTLNGVYTNKEDAIARNLDEKQQKDLPSEVSSGSLFYEDDSEWEAVMNMMALDEYENDEIKFRYGCWLCPEVECY